MSSGTISLPPPLSRPLSRSSSFSRISRSGTPALPGEDSLIPSDGMAMMRKYSMSSIPSTPPPPTFNELSAKYHMRNTRTTIDFSMPTVEMLPGSVPVVWSGDNVLLFTRGNRVHCKNMASAEDIGQVCKVPEKLGALQLLAGGTAESHMLAIACSKGYIQLWDVRSRKMTASWSSKGVTAMKWNGPTLTVGCAKGTIRHYDTRLSAPEKLKEQARKVTRHQTQIHTLAWDADGKLLASGDETGIVHVWDSRQRAPLDVGEYVQRRKKMQHTGPITALGWCPWKSKYLASGDSSPNGTSTVRLWSIEEGSGKNENKVKIEFDAGITSLHFSQHCKEIVTTHSSSERPAGAAEQSSLPTSQRAPPSYSVKNSVSVHTTNTLAHANTCAGEGPIAGSVLSPNGLKVAVAVPDEGKIHVWDVWGKRKEIKKQSSFMSDRSIR
ncbi:hypothetical protein HGRIS_006874 [Hohenbuehelia grisea]